MNNMIFLARPTLATLWLTPLQFMGLLFLCAKKIITHSFCRNPISALLFLVLALSGCDYKNCIPENSFVTIQSKSSVAHGNARKTTSGDGRGEYSGTVYGTWVDSGISSDGENQIEIAAEGIITTCSATKSMTGIVPAKFGSGENRWTDSGMSPAPGDQLTITVGAPSSSLTSNCSYSKKKTCTTYADCVNMWDNNDSSYCIKKGSGLLAYIGSSAPSADIGSPSTSQKIPELNSSGNFTMWGANDSGAVPNGGFSGKLTSLSSSGKLYFKIADCKSYSSCMHDNDGGYGISVTVVSAKPPSSCTYKDGALLDVLIVKEGVTPTYRTDGTLIKATGGYKGIPSKKGRIWLRVHDNLDTDTDYADNAGSYYVTVEKTVLDNHNVSKFVASITEPIENLLDEVTVTIYNSIIKDHEFRRIVNGCILLYVIIYAIFFMLGLIKHKQLDLVIKAAKMGVMLALISEDSWEFFNKYLFSIFSDGSKFLINAATGASGDDSNIFAFLDLTIGQFFTNTTWQKLASLIFAGPFGIIYCIVIIKGFYTYLCAVVEAVLSYLISLVAISVMIVMAPFFLIFLLFSVTRPLFDAWVSHIFNFALQPALLFAALALFNEFMVIAFYGVLNFRACWTCAYPFVIPIGTLSIPASVPFLGGKSADLDIPLGCWLWYFAPEGYNPSSLWSPASFFTTIIIFLIISDACRKFVVASSDIVAMLTEAGGGGDRLRFSSGGLMERLEAAPVGIMRTLTGTDGKSKDRRTRQAAVEEAIAKLEAKTKQVEALGGSNSDDPNAPAADGAKKDDANSPEKTITATEHGVDQKKKKILSAEETIAAKKKELLDNPPGPGATPEERAAYDKKVADVLKEEQELEKGKAELKKAEEQLAQDKRAYAVEAKNAEMLAQQNRVDDINGELAQLRKIATAENEEAIKKKEAELALATAKLEETKAVYGDALIDYRVHEQKEQFVKEQEALTQQRADLEKEAREIRATEDSLNARMQAQKAVEERTADTATPKGKEILREGREKLEADMAQLHERKEAYGTSMQSLEDKEKDLEHRKEVNTLQEMGVELSRDGRRLEQEGKQLGRTEEDLVRDKEALVKQTDSLSQVREDIAGKESYLAEKGPELDERAKQLQADSEEYEARRLSVPEDRLEQYDRVKGAKIEESMAAYLADREAYNQTAQSLESDKMLEASLSQSSSVLQTSVTERQEAFDARSETFRQDSEQHEAAKGIFNDRQNKAQIHVRDFGSSAPSSDE